MAKTSFKSVDEYLDAQPAEVQGALERVRGAIHKALPDAEEAISYQIPAFKLRGRSVLYVAGWKEHYSLYPATISVRRAFRDDLTRYEVEKSTIRFPLSAPVP